MTYVNTTTVQAEILITEESSSPIAVTTPASPVLITTVTEGPQGPAGPALSSIGQIPDVDVSNATDGSVLIYSATSSKFQASPAWTAATLTDGGNF